MKVQLTLRWNSILRWPFAMVRWKWNVSKLRWFFFSLRWKVAWFFSSCNGIMRWFLIYDGNQWPSQLKAMTSLSIVIIGPSLHRKLLQIVPMEMVRLRWCDDFETLRLRWKWFNWAMKKIHRFKWNHRKCHALIKCSKHKRFGFSIFTHKKNWVNLSSK